MKRMMILGAVALAGMAFAGSAAAGDDCTYGPLPPSGYQSTCLFDDHSYAGQNWYCTYASDYNAPASSWGYGGASGAGTSHNAGVSQYEYDNDCDYGWGPFQTSGEGTQAWAYASASTAQGYTFGGANANQYSNTYSDCCSSYAQEGTSAGAYRYVYTPATGSNGAEFSYSQYSTNGGACTEYVFFAYSVQGTWQYQSFSQPCTAQAPNLKDAGAEFPDWPDGTGAPFL